MTSEKFSTNPESFNKFGRGRQIDLVNSDGMTHILVYIRHELFTSAFYVLIRYSRKLVSKILMSFIDSI